MSKKYLSRTSNQLARAMTTMELKTVKGDEQNHSKHIERVAASPHIYLNVNAPPSSIRIDTQAIRLPVISKQRASYLAVSPLSTNEQNKAWPVENTSSNESALSTPIRNHKHKHHNGKHRHHHHHHRHNRTKTVVRQYKILSPSKATIKKSPEIEPLPNIRFGIDNQQASLVAYRDTNVQQPIVTDDISQPIFLNQDQEIKPDKGNIPLQPIENKLVSQRAAPASETQVGNYPSTFYSPSSFSSDDIQNIERILYENNLGQPLLSTNNCIYPQPDPYICHPQPQELFYCTEPNLSQQQQVIYIDGTPSTAIQPTFINQTPFLNQLPSQSILSIPQAPIQQNASYVIQQPSFSQNQPIQIIQSPLPQPVQYLSGASAFQQPQVQFVQASPQVLYQRPYDPITLQGPNQQVVVANNSLVGLSQPSYAPIRIGSAAPMRQQQLAPYIFRNALIRAVADRTGVPVIPQVPGGVQVLNSPFMSPSHGLQFGTPASHLFNNGIQRSASLPIVPLTPGGLLIPFQLSEPGNSMTHGPFSRTTGLQSNLPNYDKIRQQIQQRGQYLAGLQRQNVDPMPSFRINSPNTAVPRTSTFPSNVPAPPPLFSSNMPVSSPLYSSNLPAQPSGILSNIPQSTPAFSSTAPPAPRPMFGSQTPYPSGNVSGSSSSSSSRSSASSALPKSSARPSSEGLIYAQPSFAGSGNDLNLSAPSATYQSLRP